MEFKRELMAVLYEVAQNNLNYTAEYFIEELSSIYEIEETANGWIINDYDEEVYLSRKEIEEIIEESFYDRLKEGEWKEL